MSTATLESLAEMTHWHDKALNWDYPPDPGPWNAAENAEFDDAAKVLLALIREELGPGFDVVYEQLGTMFPYVK